MRSFREIAFRLRQEASDLWLWAHPPSVSVVEPSPLAKLPDPAGAIELLRGKPFSAEVVRIAELVLQHRFPLLGAEVCTGEEIEWRRDYLHQVTSGLAYFRRVPYLDFSQAGDHKFVWELNRHQHLVVLAQAFGFTGRREFLAEIQLEIESWLESNPFLRGINWTSALEVAFRALSWIWVYHLAGGSFELEFRRSFLTALYRHGCYLEHNLSVYFSPNTHLLGEAVALHALGTVFPGFPGSSRWKRAGGKVVAEQIERQVREDGSHFEQSIYYHLYALDMFLFHYVLSAPGPRYAERLRSMAEYLAALAGGEGVLPMLGDEDGGRLFHPYGERERFGRATLATCAVLFGNAGWLAREEDLHEQAVWWLGVSGSRLPEPSRKRPAPSRLFRQAGVAVMNAGALRVAADAGPFGAGTGGHSHSDTLSLVVRLGDEAILTDPGTYTYVADEGWRNRFRGSAAHNTVRIDGRDQALPAGPFRWTGLPDVEIREWSTTPAQDFLDAECRYAGFRHRRRFLLVKPDLLLVLDEIEGPDGEHLIEQFWHCGEAVSRVAPGCFRIGARTLLMLPAGGLAELLEGGEHGWHSPVFGKKMPAPVVRVRRKTALPAALWAALDFSG